jgi:hypothetical protein
MNKRWLLFLILLLPSCSILDPTIIQPVNNTTASQYANYCEMNYSGPRSAGSVAVSGFASVEQQCGVFFDKLAELTEFGRFSSQSLSASNLAAQSIMQAAKAAADSVTIVSASITLTQAVFNAFVQQYAFSPYLYKIRQLTWDAFEKHQSDNATKLSQLKGGFLADDYCDAAVLIQQHASVCSISSIQSLFDQQVALPSLVSSSGTKQNGPVGKSLHGLAGPTLGFTPIVSPNFRVIQP